MTPSEEATGGTGPEDEAANEDKPKLSLDVKVDSPTICQRHISVTVSRDDIERYFDDAFGELMPTAAVPGFRAGRAPRKLVEQRFRKDVAEQVKGSLLMDSISQVSEDQDFSAISEPDFDIGAIDIPAEGAMTFEFDLEVRPEFELPQWKGLKLEKPERQITDQDIDSHLTKFLSRHAKLVPHDGNAAVNDSVVINLSFKKEDQVLSEAKEQTIRVQPVLSFHDGKIEGFDKLIHDMKSGDTQEVMVTVSQDSPKQELRGEQVAAQIELLDVKKLELPELTEQLLQEIGGFDSEGDLRDAIDAELKRQLRYHQLRRIRQQITAMLTESADWELPPELLQRQSRRELERAVLELQSSGFSDDEIRAHENELRQNTLSTTATALKEHFILERIAEEEGVDVEPRDYDLEIAMIASQSGDSPRRVRAQLEKREQMDALRNQIIERKVVERIGSHATYQVVEFKPEDSDVEAIDHAIGGADDSFLLN